MDILHNNTLYPLNVRGPAGTQRGLWDSRGSARGPAGNSMIFAALLGNQQETP
jgi:hypothetical protein